MNKKSISILFVMLCALFLVGAVSAADTADADTIAQSAVADSEISISEEIDAVGEVDDSIQSATESQALSVAENDQSSIGNGSEELINSTIAAKNVTSIEMSKVNLTATLTDSDNNTPIENKTVDFYVGAALAGSALTDKEGIATVLYTPSKAGTIEYTAVFNQTGYAPANASAFIQVSYYAIPTVALNPNSTLIQTYGSYLGGNGFDKGKGVYVDGEGNIYVAMESNSKDFNTTPGAFQSSMAGARDIVLAKFSKTGELLYLTYFGGSKNEMHKDLKIDAYGNAYVVGFTNSPNFPTTENAIKKSLSGIQNAFLAVFDTNGTLIYSTLIGAENVDRAFAVAVDDSYNAYVLGITNSNEFNVTADAYQPVKKGAYWNSSMSSADITFQNSFDLFLTKINVNTSTIEYSTLFGTEAMDTTEGSLDVDENGIIYFGGYTSGLFLDVTDNAIQKERCGGDDAFLVALDPANKKLLFSSYIGGSDDDIGGEILVDDGFLYYVGDTWSPDFSVTKDAYQKEFKGTGNNMLGGDAYVMKINTTSWELMYSTYLGGTGDDGIGDMDVDADGNLYLLFSTESTDFPISDNAFQLDKNGLPYSQDTITADNDYLAFDTAVVKLSADGSKVLYSTYFGGSSGEMGFGFNLCDGGFVLFIRTYSDDMVVTENAYQKEHGADSVSSSLGRTGLNYMDTYLGIFENPTIIAIENITAKLGSNDLVATLTSSMDNTPLANKAVDFYVNNTLVGTALTDEKGVAKLSYNVETYGTIAYSAVFNETLGHAAANASALLSAPVVINGGDVEVNPDSALVLDFATYLGGNGNDKAKGVYVDKDGNIFVAMETDSSNVPTTAKAYQSANNGGKDLFVAKYSKSGELIYATYIGGSKTEMQKDIKVDSQGNVYLTGFTNSPDLPVTSNAFQKELPGSQAAFLVVLNPEGTDLIYSSYLGGNVVDRAWALVIDDNGSAYLQGITNSLDFPVTPDAYQKSKDGVNWSVGDPDDINYQNSFDLFLAKFNINSGNLEYATYFGAKGSDSTYGGLAVDANDVMYFTGSTTSIDFPVTENAYRDVRDAGADSFLAALDTKNGKLLFSSYIGGNGTEEDDGLFLDKNGFLYFIGDTLSENFITTENAYKTEIDLVDGEVFESSSFIMKIDTSNWNLVYSTLLGGSLQDGIRAITVDDEGNAFLVGLTQSEDFPVTANAYQLIKSAPYYGGVVDPQQYAVDYDYPTHEGFISVLSADGSKLLYSSFFGGNSGDLAMGITLTNGGFIVQMRSASTNLPVTSNAAQKEHALDLYNTSLMGRVNLYDYDNYFAVFTNPTIMTLADVSGKLGELSILSVTLKDSMANRLMANKSVDFYVDGAFVGSAVTDENGVAKLSYNPTKTGTLEYTAVFNETLGHAAANASAGLKIAYYDIPTVDPNPNSSINLKFGTYLGGNGNDKGKGIYTDKDGNIYVAMETNSNDLFTTEGAYQSKLVGTKDLFVAKYSPAGDLIYATYIGGSGTEMQKDLKVDSLGNVYIIGFTNSKDMPVTANAYQKVVNGSQDAFLIVLNPNGTDLVYSTYLGGDVVDRAWALAIDDEGTAYIQGITNSINFPVTADAFQKTKDGVNWTLNDPDDINYQNSFDLFLSKLNIYSGELEYSTFFGAKGSDSTYGTLAVDKNEVFYFGGTTTSLDFPTTANAFRDVRAESSDSFLAALDIKNGKLLFSSYIGGNDADDGEALVVTPNGFLYYVGDTWSDNFNTTAGAFQATYGGVGEGISGGDMFIMKIDTSNWTLVYSTLLGGEFDEGVRALAVDEYENAWVVGMSQSENYPVTADAYQNLKNGLPYISYAKSTDYDYATHDTVISKISPDGSKVLYSTFFGGNSGEFAMGITFVNGGFALQIRTCSDDLIVFDDTKKGQDQFTGSILGNDPLYDFDSYIAVFENPTILKIENATVKDKSVSLSVTVKEAMGDSILPNKAVDLLLGDKILASAVSDENGIATFDIEIPQGLNTLNVVFNETIGHAAATESLMVVSVSSPKLESNFNVSAGTSIATYAVDFGVKEPGSLFKFQLTDSEGKPIANATVYFAYKTTYFNRTTDENGTVVLGINTQVAGEYLCALSYLGDETHNATFVPFSFNIQKKALTISAASKSYKASAKTKKYTVTLKTQKNANGKTYLKKGKKVTLKISGKTYTAKTNDKGQATFSLKITKKGKFTAKIKFEGDNTYNAASKSVKITIK